MCVCVTYNTTEVRGEKEMMQLYDNDASLGSAVAGAGWNGVRAVVFSYYYLNFK